MTDVDWDIFDNKTELPESEWPDSAVDLMDVIATVLRTHGDAVRAETIEACAKVADKYQHRDTGREIADAIRALSGGDG